MTTFTPTMDVFEPAPSPQRITLAALRLASEGIEEAVRLLEASGESGERQAMPAVERAERQIAVARMLMTRPAQAE